jgi:flagellar protein FlbD
MIRVTKLNGEVFYVNPYEIEFIEETPDTVISLKSGKKVLVSEKADVVINEMIDFYRAATPLPKPYSPDPEDTDQFLGDPMDGGEGA